MQDVAVKVLTIQDFEDDQLKEFLREVFPFIISLFFILRVLPILMGDFYSFFLYKEIFILYGERKG